MTDTEIIQYYDYLIRLAISKCNSQTDAEDLVGETMLAAFAYIHKGGTIEHPKTWLATILCHKYSDNLRKKYREPIILCLDDNVDVPDDEDKAFFASDEAARVRKELNHLSFITREVLIRFYFGNQSVLDIAEGLNIPEGTVKSRLFSGRDQMKKGFEMEARENYLPGKLNITYGGSGGLKGEPRSLVDDDLIAQNILIIAYEKPITISELSRAIGIPAAYIEPIVKKLVDGELMVQTDSGKVYTDFIIRKAQDILKCFNPQLDFAHRHFEEIWNIIKKMSADILSLPFVQELGCEEKTKLDRYAVLKALQDFQYFGTNNIELPKFPKRKDGGRWLANAIAFEAGYNIKEFNESFEYIINGGHRTSEALSLGRAKKVRFYEFDTTLYDSPARFGGAYELYFKHIIPLLWHIYDDIPIENADIPNEFISYIPTLERLGLIGNTDGKRCLNIPVLKKADYDELCTVIKKATEELKSSVGEAFGSFIASMKSPVPKHLTSVPELFRYNDASIYFVMAIVREAYDKGLHLKGVDHCCPPVVLVYEE